MPELERAGGRNKTRINGENSLFVECPECGAGFLVSEKSPAWKFSILNGEDVVVGVENDISKAVALAKRLGLEAWTVRETKYGRVVRSKVSKPI